MSIALTLTETERRVLVDLLNQLHDHQSTAGCNDYELPVTPEGLQFAVLVETSAGYDSTDVVYTADTIYMTDWMITDYFLGRLDEDGAQ